LLQKNFTIDPICKIFQIGQNISQVGFQIKKLLDKKPFLFLLLKITPEG
jgi:hypothetical protein